MVLGLPMDRVFTVRRLSDLNRPQQQQPHQQQQENEDEDEDEEF